MTATQDRPAVEIGRERRRKEDQRLITGRTRWTDNLAVPGMLHMAMVRSPMAHARITSIDTSAAEAHPQVKAVITGAVLETLNLAWMPTLSADVQAVLDARVASNASAVKMAYAAWTKGTAAMLIAIQYGCHLV